MLFSRLVRRRNSKTDWQIAQKAELECWTLDRAKFQSPIYLQAKKAFWRSVLNMLRNYVSLADLSNKKVLEFGCGPTGIFLLVDKNPQYLCLDPLMNEYLNHFPFVRKSGVSFINSKIEDYHNTDKFDFILGFNALDHVDDIQRAIKRVYDAVSHKGLVIISVNVHNYSFFQQLLSRTYSIFDKLHKHQYTSRQYRDLFLSTGFNVVDEICLDSALQQFANRLKSVHEHGSWRQWLSPAGLLFGVFRLLGMRRHGYGNSENKSIYSAKCYLLKR